MGGFSSTSYSENIGLIGLTKVASRFVVQIGAVILILLGLFGKFGALAAAIPQPVVGGLYCAMFGLIAAVGVRQFARADLNSDRNLFIGGFALFMGLSVPFYFSDFSTGPADVAWMPKAARDIVSGARLDGHGRGGRAGDFARQHRARLPRGTRPRRAAGRADARGRRRRQRKNREPRRHKEHV